MPSRSTLGHQSGAGLRGVAVHHRPAILAGVDALAWAIGVLFATVVRFDFELDEVEVGAWLALAALAAFVQMGVGRAFGLYTRRSRLGGPGEMANLVGGTFVATVVLFGLNVMAPDGALVPRSAVVGGGVVATVLMCGVRFAWHRWLRRQRDVLVARAAS